MIRLLVRVSGRVQGVWYRQSTLEQAERLGVAGYVRNLADGDVEAALEGPAEAVTQMLGWMRIGPPGAAVIDVRVTTEVPQGDTGFRVLR